MPYNNAPMHPVGRHSQPVTGPTTKPLSTAAQTTVVGATGWNAYITTADETTVFYNQTVVPIAIGSSLAGVGGGPSVLYPQTLPQADTSGVAAPAAPTLTLVPGTWPAGTYTVVTTYTSVLGESLPSSSTTVTLDGAHAFNITSPIPSPTGYGTVTINVPKLEDWSVTRYAVYASSNISEPIADVYTDAISATNLIDGTYTGSRDSSDCTGLYLRPGQLLICRWLQADIGATLTFTVVGSKTS
jgi:hypothetical protein